MLGPAKVWSRKLLDGFWFVPGAVVVAYIALAALLVEIDRSGGEDGIGLGFSGDADAARGILSTIAGSLITVAGLAFSLTIVVLVLVSSQFTPRALPRFLGDRVNQLTAGAFVGIFAYSLVVLRTIRSSDDGGESFVPSLSITVGIGFALLALALLLLFIHHMSVSIQASHLVARLGEQTRSALERLYPDPHGEAAMDWEPEDLLRAWREEGRPAEIGPARAGYVVAIELDSVVECFGGADARVHVAVRPGDFVTEGSVMVSVWPPSELNDERHAALRRAISIENERDLRQDGMYGVRQLADIAVKALSPGINDPTTATTCVGYLRHALEGLAGRDVPRASRRTSGGTVVMASGRGFAEYAEAAFDEVGRYASDDARVTLAVLDALAGIASAARAPSPADRVAVIAELALSVGRPALDAARSERDRRLIASGLERMEALAL